MKILNVAAIVAAAALSACAFSQGRPGGPPGGGPGGPGGGFGGGRGRMTPQEAADRMVQMMTPMLNLTPAQQAKVKAIVLKNQLAIKKIRDGQEAEIKKVLTADQVKKMAAMPRPGGPGGGMRGGPGGGGRRGGK